MRDIYTVARLTVLPVVFHHRRLFKLSNIRRLFAPFIWHSLGRLSRSVEAV